MNFSWPIIPPPFSTRGQLFTAKLPSGKPHNALDMGTGGNVVLAPAPGVVSVNALSRDSRGRILHIDHGEGYQTRYYHLAGSYVARGTPVEQGQKIALVGRTGLPKNNPHLHFMVLQGGVPIDPLSVLPPRAGGGYTAPGLAQDYEEGGEADSWSLMSMYDELSEDDDSVNNEGDYEELPPGQEIDAPSGGGVMVWVVASVLALWWWVRR